MNRQPEWENYIQPYKYVKGILRYIPSIFLPKILSFSPFFQSFTYDGESGTLWIYPSSSHPFSSIVIYGSKLFFTFSASPVPLSFMPNVLQ